MLGKTIWLLSMGVATTMTITMSGIAWSGASENKNSGARSTEKAEPTEDESRQAKEEFRRDMEKELSRVEKNLKDLRTKTEAATGDAKAELTKQLTNLESRRKEIAVSLDKLSHQSGRAWVKMKSGLVKAMSELQTSFKEARREFNEDEARRESKQ